MMYYGAIKKFDIANGEGIRVSLFVSGCRNRCKGCFQPETWSFTYGKPFSDEAMSELISALENPSVRGLTVLGGEPMEPENQEGLLPVLKKVKAMFPEKNIWLYTGNLYEELVGLSENSEKCIGITAELLSLVDILVDGRYEEDKHRLGLRFRGSENQRIIDMNKTRAEGRVVIWQGSAEDKKWSAKNEG
jgi:anaerobic ribonucleoside-triphosphate reductase activating protein